MAAERAGAEWGRAGAVGAGGWDPAGHSCSHTLRQWGLCLRGSQRGWEHTEEIQPESPW